MAVIVVGGRGRGVGKTSLVCGLIAGLAEFRWTAVKITSHEHVRAEPVWEETVPGQGTDTARYLAAGAGRALLVTAAQEDLSGPMKQLWAMLPQNSNVIFESNRVLEWLKPEICLMVEGDANHGAWKPSFSVAVQRADALVAHADADRMLEEGSPSRPLFHLAALEKISPEMLAWMRERLRSTPRC